MFQRVDGGRGDNAGLAHGAAEQLAGVLGFPDKVFRPAEKGSHGSSQPLGDAEHERVRVLGQLLYGNAEICGGVENARAVHVDWHAVFIGQAADGGHALRRDTGSTGVIVGVLDADQLDRVPLERAFHVGRVGHAVGVEFVKSFFHLAEARVEGGFFAAVEVLQLVDQHGVAGTAPGQQGGLVAHRAGDAEQHSLLARERCRHVLQFVDRSVFAASFRVQPSVIAQRRRQDRLQHGTIRKRERIAP